MKESLVQIASEFGAEYIVEEEKGLSLAINRGWEHLAPDLEFVTWLGDDDILAPSSLEQSTKALRSHKDAAFSYGRTMYIDSVGAPIYRSYPTRFAPLYLKIGQDYVPQPGSLIRVSAVNWYPFLDESLKNAMDLDMFLKLSRKGSKSWIYIPAELSAYRIHGEAITQTKGAFDESEWVRGRYRGNIASKVSSMTAIVRKFIEKLYVWSLWNFPTPNMRQHNYYETGSL